MPAMTPGKALDLYRRDMVIPEAILDVINDVISDRMKCEDDRLRSVVDMADMRDAIIEAGFSDWVRGGPSSRITMILAAYRAVGWKVEYEHDQRDGDFFTFECQVIRPS